MSASLRWKEIKAGKTIFAVTSSSDDKFTIDKMRVVDRAKIYKNFGRDKTLTNRTIRFIVGSTDGKDLISHLHNMPDGTMADLSAPSHSYYGTASKAQAYQRELIERKRLTSNQSAKQ